MLSIVDNDNGATAFCKMLGFSSGKAAGTTKTAVTFKVDAMHVGRCGAGEKLHQCTVLGNKWGNTGMVGHRDATMAFSIWMIKINSTIVLGTLGGRAKLTPS